MISFFIPLNLNRNLFRREKISPNFPSHFQFGKNQSLKNTFFPRQNDFTVWNFPPLENNLLPKKMINLLQETKKKVEAKNLLSRFPEFDRRSIFAAALYEKLAADAATAGAVNQFVPAENILKSEANIGLLGREDECECLSELFFMRAHGIIHDACGRAYCEMGVGKGYCYAVENPTIFMKSSPFLGHISGIAFCIWNRKKLRKIFE